MIQSIVRLDEGEEEESEGMGGGGEEREETYSTEMQLTQNLMGGGSLTRL